MENCHGFLPHSMWSWHTELGCMRNRRNTEELFMSPGMNGIFPKCLPGAVLLQQLSWGRAHLHQSFTHLCFSCPPTNLADGQSWGAFQFHLCESKNYIEVLYDWHEQTCTLDSIPNDLHITSDDFTYGQTRQDTAGVLVDRHMCLKAWCRCIIVYFL